MCCGVSQNSYHTLRDMRVVLTDGTVLDTADPVSRESFLRVREGRSRGAGVQERAGGADRVAAGAASGGRIV